MKEVLNGAALSLVLHGLSAGLAFVLNVVIARLLGAEGAGLYFLALSVITIGAIVAKLGLDNTLLRFIASGAAEKNWGQVKGVFTLGMKLAGTASLALALLCFAFAPWIAEYLFHEYELTEPLRWMCLGLFTYSMMTLLAESLKGLKCVRNSILVSGVVQPVFALIIIWPLVIIMGPAGASLAYVLATGMAVGFGIIFWRHKISTHDEHVAPFKRETLLASSRPLWLMSIVNRAVLPWAPLFLLGIWGTAEDSGVFGAATRMSMLVAFLLHSANIVLAPKFAELYTKGDLRALGHLARRIALLITLAASPLFLLLIFAGEWVMGLFGVDFIRGGTALAILAIGQAVNTITGPVGYLLMMSGHESDLKSTSLFSAILMALCAVILIPSYGIIGAALASTMTTIGMSLMATYYVRLRLGIVLLPGISKAWG